MTSVTRLAPLAALGLALTACPPKPPPPPPDAGDVCYENVDCPDQNLFFCNKSTSTCEPACRTKGDCTAAVRGEFALDYCAGNLGCQCDEGKCVASLCSSDLDCGSQVCRDGACVPPPPESSITSCQITPDYLVMRQGAKAKFFVSTWDASKKPVVPKTGVTWSALTAAVTGSGTGLTAEFTAAATNTTPEEAVQAAIGGATCKAKVLVLPGTVPANNIDVLAIDELSGRPISGATVLASVPTTGATIGSTGTTDAKGYARLNITGGNTAATVSVFHNDYNYLSIANYSMSAAGNDARFLSFVMRRNQVDKYGGYKGTMTNVPATSNVHAAIVGMSLAGSITDLSVSQLLGPTTPTHVKIGSAIDKADVPLPAGAYLGFGESPIKTNVSGQGLAGVCTDAMGMPREAEILAGTCGTRTAWALSGDVAIADLPIDAFAGGTSNIDYGAVLSRITPIFKKFGSSIVRDVQFTLKTTPRDAAGDPVFTDVAEFTPVDQQFAQIPLAFEYVLRSPDLPQFKGTYVDGVVLLGGAVVPGRGVVPLGIGAGVNQSPQDAKADTQGTLAGPGLIPIRMAPTHHGTEGSDYGVIALAVSLKSATDATAGLASSAVMGRVPKNQLLFDPAGSTVIDLPGSFLKFPEAAKYNFTNNPIGALTARTFKFATDPGLTGTGGASVLRIVFTDRLDHRWVVLLDPAQATTGFTLPTAPGSFSDRTFHTGNVTESRSSMLVQAIRLNSNPSGGGSAMTFQNLVELNSTNADRMVDYTTGFVFIDYDRPEVKWEQPKSTGATIPKESTIKVKVTGFKVGTTASDDGFVKVTFAGATCTAVEGKADTSQGKGEISMTLPAGCVGSNVTLTATLHDNAGAAIQPPAASSIQVTISP